MFINVISSQQFKKAQAHKTHPKPRRKGPFRGLQVAQLHHLPQSALEGGIRFPSSLMPDGLWNPREREKYLCEPQSLIPGNYQGQLKNIYR